MRILFITLFFPPTHNAGTENYTLALAEAFRARGYDDEVICAEDWQSGAAYWNGVTEDVYNGVPIYRLHLNWMKADNPNRILYDSQPVEEWLDRFLVEHQVDLVHVTSTITLGVGIFRSVKRAGIPLVLTLMDFWFLCPSIQLLRSDMNLCDGQTTAWECQSCLLANSNLYLRLSKALPNRSIHSQIWGTLAKLSPVNKQRSLRGMLLDMTERKQLMSQALALPDLVLTHSEFVKQVLTQHTPVHIEVLRNGHDFSWQHHYHGKTKSDQFRFGYIGQIHPIKGLHVLIAAFQKTQFGEQARLEIWGDISHNEQYVQRLQEITDDNPSIVLHGRFDHDHLATVLAGIDVLVVPSLWYENAPLVIQEAFAAKTPVITTNLGGMAEAVTHEVNGLLFERGDAADLAKQLRRLVEEPGLLEQLQAGIPAVKTASQEVLELEAIYQQLLVPEQKTGTTLA